MGSSEPCRLAAATRAAALLPRPTPPNSHSGRWDSSPSTSSQRSTAIASTSKPGPRLAMEAGTLTFMAPSSPFPPREAGFAGTPEGGGRVEGSQLESLGERARIAVQLHGRRYVAERSVRVLQPAASQDDD